ncbi:MAG: tail fiber domain-containing protein [Flavobacteriales bacterium]|nr:tail fiber domain-containing protein [Flavobacteriales bacterium]
MRSHLLVALAVLCTGTLLAQAPDAFNYQAVAQDANGDALVNALIGVEFKVRQGSLTGTAVYSETHDPTTDERGLFSLKIGSGTPNAGSFATIDWSAGPYFLEVRLDPLGGSSYTKVGAEQLVSVPYALHAKTASVVDDGDWVLSGDTLSVVGRRIGIGTATPSDQLHVSGSFRLDDGTAAEGRVLTSDMDGHATWSSVPASAILGELPAPPLDTACLDVVFEIPGAINTFGSDIRGRYAYFVDYYAGKLRIADLIDPSTPVIVGEAGPFGIGIGVQDVAVSGDHAFCIGNSNGNLSVLNISDPTAPFPVSSVLLTSVGNLRKIVADNAYAYVISAISGLFIIDISDPILPPVVVHNIPVNGYSLAVRNNTLYTFSNAGELFIYDISDRTSPVLLSTTAIGPGSFSDIDLKGDLLYLAHNGGDELVVIDISDGSAPVVVSTLSITEALAVELVGDIALVIPRTTDDLYLVDISEPSSPSILLIHHLLGGTYSVVHQAGYAYVGCAAVGVNVVRLSCPSHVLLDPASGTIIHQPAQWDSIGDDLVNGNTGNVGIGTNAPEYTMHISNGANTGSSAFGRGLKITDNTPRIYFEESDAPVNEKVMFLEKISDGISFSSVIDDATAFLKQHILFVKGSGHVGIGLADPAFKLQTRVNAGPAATLAQKTGLFLDNANQSGSIGAPSEVALVFGENSSAKQAITGGTWGNDHLRFYTGSNFTDARMAIIANGNIGISTPSPSAKLSVNGTANNSTGSWGVFSDSRIKTEQRLFTDGLNVIDHLRPIVFTYNADAPFETEGEQVGIIAQELEKLAPYMVSTTEHGDISDLREVNNQAYTFLLINAVKELKAENDRLQADNDQLKTDHRTQQEQIEANAALLQELKAVLEAEASK